MKIRFRYICIAVVIVIFAFCKGIGLANDRIARAMEARLTAYPLPANTVLVDSKAIAGRVAGNGNGMQYRGMLLLGSELTEEELLAHYKPLCGENEFLWIGLQESRRIFEYQNYWFDTWDESQTMWYVELFTDSLVGYEKTLWEEILNMDLRGH